VWPSIWEDNRGIDNPHLINPGDRIWITSTLMRRISDEEAARYLAASEAAGQDSPAAAEDDAAMDDGELALDQAPEGAEVDVPMDQLSMGVQGEDEPVDSDGSLHISWRESLGVLAENADEISSPIVGGPSPRYEYAQGDEIYFTIPKEGVAVGDQFSIFRDAVRVRDPGTNAFIGSYIEALGWGEVTAVGEDVATMLVSQSITEMEAGDRVIPRRFFNQDISLREAPAGLEAQVAYVPNSRGVVALYDHVYLNRGSLHGLQEGMQLEVYQAGGYGDVGTHRVDKRLPDRVMANLVVVNVQPNGSVAVLTASAAEIEVGATVRPQTHKLAFR
jgi:hypothetical protein